LHEVFLMLILIFIVGVLHFLVRDLLYSNSNNWNFKYFKEEVYNAYEVGVFIALIVIIINQLSTNNVIKKHKEKSENKSSVIENSISDVAVLPDNKSDNDIDPSDFVYAKSFGNYTEIFLKTDNKIIKKLERITLGNLFDNLSKDKSILRVHKSYIVNINEVDSVNGNSAGLKLTLTNLPNIIIPVSRSNVEKFEKLQVLS